MTQEATLTGTHLGPYRLVRRLRKGGMGRVYLAVSPSGRAVAIKALLAEVDEFPNFRRRFQNEIKAARKVSGAFTAAIVDADPEATPPWLATEFIAGPSLQDAVENFGTMTGQDLILLAAGVAEALAAIHDVGLIHRDLTPSNILLGESGPRVIDFGISRLVDEQGQAQPSSRILGLPGYMSPERIRGEATDASSDVFSLGAVIAFASQGHSPFGEAPDPVLLERTLNDPPQLGGVPPLIRGLIEDCLDKNPQRRPPSQNLARLLGRAPSALWAKPLARRIRQDRNQLTAALSDRRLSRRALLTGGAALVTAAAATTIVIAEKNGSSVQGPGTLTLAWSATLANASMTATAFDTTTVVCAGRLGTSSFDRTNGRALWSSANPRGETDSSDGQRVYAVRSNGRMYALDARTGRQLWVSGSADQPEFQLATPTTIILKAGGRLLGLASDSGATRWTYSLNNDYLGTKGTGAGQLIIYSVDTSNFNGASTFTVLDLDTGSVRWTRPLMALYAPPSGTTFYAIDTAMNLLALRASDGKTLWSKPTTLPSETTVSLLYDSSLGLSQGTLFCYPDTSGNESGTGILTAFDPTDGGTFWSVNPTTDAGGYATADQVVCYLDGSMKTVDGRTGKALWSAGGGLGLTQLAGTANGMFLAAAPGNGLYGWDMRTGQETWHYPVAGGSGRWSFLQPSGGLLASYAGRLYSFRA